MKKVVILDKIGKIFEPYDRMYILEQVAGICYRNSSILRNASMTSVWRRGYANGRWEDHCKWVSCVSFEVDEITEKKWKFLLSSIGSWAVEIEVLPDDCETTVIFPSEFKK